MPKNKVCEVCHKEIPDDFANALCLECYNKQVKEIADKKAQEEADKKKKGYVPVTAPIPTEKPFKEPTEPSKEDVKVVKALPKSIPWGSVKGYNKNGITDPNYIENPEMDDKEQWKFNVIQFERSGRLLWDETKAMYTYIKDYLIRKVLEHPQYPKFIWKPKIVDAGCGCGVGANLISMEADFVWGIDKNASSIKFATEAFAREKNGIYYSSQVSFDQVDLLTDTREFMKFDFVTCIEVIEHVYDYKTLLKNLIRFAKKDKKGSYNIAGFPTEFFISTPNRNNIKISKRNPGNKAHVREWTSEEFHVVLSEFFEKIELFDRSGNPVAISSDNPTILAKCSLPKI